MLNKLMSIPIFLLILFATFTPAIADTGYSSITNYADVAPSDLSFSIAKGCAHIEQNSLDKPISDKSIDYGADYLFNNLFITTNYLTVNKLLKPDKYRFRLASLGDFYVVDFRRRHYPLE